MRRCFEYWDTFYRRIINICWRNSVFHFQSFDFFLITREKENARIRHGRKVVRLDLPGCLIGQANLQTSPRACELYILLRHWAHFLLSLQVSQKKHITIMDIMWQKFKIDLKWPLPLYQCYEQHSYCISTLIKGGGVFFCVFELLQHYYVHDCSNRYNLGVRTYYWWVARWLNALCFESKGPEFKDVSNYFAREGEPSLTSNH